MIDFDRQWEATNARIERRQRFVMVIIALQVIMAFCAAVGAIWLGVAMIHAGPEAIAGAAGRAVAAFDHARSAR